MSKESKITVKHYLNTNLKAYKIRNEDFYNLYMLVTTKNRNTKVKSNCFSELYTQNEFEDFMKEGSEASELIKNEVETVTNILRTQLNLSSDINEFDTVLFSAFYNLMPNYSIYEVLRTVNSFNLYFLDDFDLVERGASGALLTFYDWFKPEIQKEIKLALSKKEGKTPIMENVNKAIMLCFFNVLCEFLNTKKYEILKNKYAFWLHREGVVRGIKEIKLFDLK